MLEYLHVKNYALIEELEIWPDNHFITITGETGAGKSIILGALGLLTGNRADTKSLLNNNEKCVIEGHFMLEGDALKSIFEEEDLDYDEECIIRREILPSGKSRAFVNDMPATLDKVTRIGYQLLDIHSQHESLELSKPNYQIDMLDLYADTTKLVKEYQDLYKRWTSLKKELQDIESRASEINKDQDFKNFQLDELEKANIDVVADASLETELDKVENTEEISKSLNDSIRLLSGEEFSALNQLYQIYSLLGPIRSFGEDLTQFHDRIDSSIVEIKELSREMEHYVEGMDLDPEKLNKLRERQNVLNRLMQKHTVSTVEELADIKEKLRAEGEEYNSFDDKIAKLKLSVDVTYDKLEALGQELSKQRKAIAPDLEKQARTLLSELGMPEASIIFDFSSSAPQPSGLDQVELLFTANKGIEPKPIKKVASGGEFSRLLFTIKYILAEKVRLPTIIFDEIDTGISGEIAIKMSGLMHQMAKKHQLMVITHLPQIAAKGDSHYFVYKDNSGKKTKSVLQKLNKEDRINEIAKMISGDKPSESAVSHAKELLSLA